MTREAGWIEKRYRTATFDLVTYRPPRTSAGQALTIMIEGDGRAWLRRDRPSGDPTPIDQVALRLAMSLKHDVAYVARPCQFVTGEEARNCQPAFWTNARFAPEVVDAVNDVVDRLRRETSAPAVRLAGYSGGGTLAALVALARTDVVELITVAAPLDTDAWTAYHKISPLRYSRNPTDRITALAKIPQVHLVGTNDEVVPPRLSEAFVRKMPKGSRVRLKKIEGADHTCCWEAAFSALVRSAPATN